MRRWLVIALFAFGIAVAVWHNQRTQTEKARLSARWMEPGWVSLTSSAGPEMWVRRIHLRNSTDEPLLIKVFGFVGETPDGQAMERFARTAIESREIDLGSGETATTGVWMSDDPASGIRLLAFSSSRAELAARLDLRQRYPFAKILWPLPYVILDVAEFSETPL